MIRAFLTAIALLATPALAEPERVWALPFEDERTGAFSFSVVPERGRALAAVGNWDFQEVWLLDLETGAVADVITPAARHDMPIESIAASADHIAVLVNNGAGIKDRRWEVQVYDFDTLTLQHRLTVPDELQGYGPGTGGAQLWMDGDHLLMAIEKVENYENLRPGVLQFDLTTGAIVRGIGMSDMLPEAQGKADKPVTPDYFFFGAVVSDGKIYSAPKPWDTPSPIRPIGFDLDTGEMAPPLAIFDGTPDFTTLLHVTESTAIYALTPPFSTSNVVGIGKALRVDRATNETLAEYPDPFAPSQTELSFDDFRHQHITTGLRPYTGSWYPERASISGGYFVATAPNAPAGGPVGSGAIVVYTLDGAPYTIIGSQAPKADLFFGRDFAHSGDYILTVDKNPAIDHYAARSLVLYKLD